MIRRLAAVSSFVAGSSVSASHRCRPRRRPRARCRQPAAAAPLQPNDYKDDTSWLCRPGRKGDACDVDLTTTVVAADGTLTREAFTPDPNAPIDCFYVYPTVSADATPNSDMSQDPAEKNVVLQQFARFASKCRAFAPMYRQITLRGLQAALAANADPLSLFGKGASVRRRARCVAALLEERQPGPRRGVDRPLAGRVHPAGADRQRDRRQADPEAARRRLHPGRDVPDAKGQGRRRAVQADPALPQGGPDRLRRQLLGVPLDGDAAGEHAVRQQRRSGVVRELHESGDAGARRRATARLSVGDRQDDRHGRGTAEAVGGGQDHRHAVCQRARPADGGMQDQRVRDVSGDQGQR